MKVELENGSVFRVGDSYDDGFIFSIVVGEELKKDVEGFEWEDCEGNRKEVYSRLDVVDDFDEGWSVYLDKEGNELLDV